MTTRVHDIAYFVSRCAPGWERQAAAYAHLKATGHAHPDLGSQCVLVDEYCRKGPRLRFDLEAVLAAQREKEATR